MFIVDKIQIIEQNKKIESFNYSIFWIGRFEKLSYTTFSFPIN